MKIKKLVGLDWRENDNRYELESALRKIPPLSSNCDLQNIQKVLNSMCKKYRIYFSISQDPESGDGFDILSCYIYNPNANEDKTKLVYCIHGICIEEILVKSTLIVYAYTRKIKKNGEA